MEEGFVVLFVLLMLGLGGLAGNAVGSQVERQDWRFHCTQYGQHVADGKVYECKPTDAGPKK